MGDRLTTYKEYLDKYLPEKPTDREDKASREVEDPARVAAREAERTTRRLREALTSTRAAKKTRGRSGSAEV